MAPITNRRATATLDGLDCEVTYNITARVSLDGNSAVSSHETISSGPCPRGMLTVNQYQLDSHTDLSGAPV